MMLRRRVLFDRAATGRRRIPYSGHCYTLLNTQLVVITNTPVIHRHHYQSKLKMLSSFLL